ncbi:MAG: hypothetical protein ACKVOK_09585 [Flavobacteriales bacterium]
MIHKKYLYGTLLTMLVIGYSTGKVIAQDKEDLYQNELHFGLTFSPYTSLKISEFKKTIIRDEYYADSTYQTSENRRNYMMFGLFAIGSPDFSEHILSFQLGLEYYFPTNSSMGKSKKTNFHYQDYYHYSNGDDSLTYDIQLNYHFLSIPIAAGLQGRFGAFFIGAKFGVRPMFNITPNRINYTSSQETNDLQIEANLKETLVGRNLIMPWTGATFIYDFGAGKPTAGLDIVWNFNSTDAVETLANGYNFIDNNNRANSIGANFFFTFPITGN